MSQFYRDYIWKGGLPYGLEPTLESTGIAYKVLSDPYHRQVFVEQYKDSLFQALIYDSRLLNFRKLNPQNQVAWEREIVNETDDTIVAELRNQDDQLIVIETMKYENGLCKSCTLSSSHGIVLSEHCMSYKHLGDAFDGVTLYDSNKHQVMVKKYVFDEEAAQFSDLLAEVWE